MKKQDLIRSKEIDFIATKILDIGIELPLEKTDKTLNEILGVMYKQYLTAGQMLYCIICTGIFLSGESEYVQEAFMRHFRANLPSLRDKILSPAEKQKFDALSKKKH